MRHEPRLQLQLVETGNGLQVALEQQSASHAHGRAGVQTGALCVGCEVRQHRDRLAAPVIDDRNGCHDGAAVYIDGG